MAGRWFVVTVVGPSEESLSRLAEGLVAFGAGGVEEAGLELRAWLPPPDEPARFRTGIAEALAEIAGEAVTVRWEWRADRDWLVEWKRGLGPRRVGDRLIVTPGWCDPEAGPGDVVLVIDPGMAFGTGEHATTRGCLRLLERTLRPGARVLDVGTGSGVLAIAAARLGADRVEAIESDPDAVAVARENVERNRVAERVEVRLEEASPASLARLGDGRRDIVIANILSSVITPLLPSLERLLAGEGAVVLGGVLREEAAAVCAVASAAGLTVDAEDEEAGWWSGRARRS